MMCCHSFKNMGASFISNSGEHHVKSKTFVTFVVITTLSCFHLLFPLMTHYSNMTGATCEAGSAYPLGAYEFTPSFCRVHVFNPTFIHMLCKLVSVLIYFF